MALKFLIPAIFLLFTACTSQPAGPAVTATPIPMQTSPPAPTDPPVSTPTPSDVFGRIPLNSVQAFNIEPVAQAVFERALAEYEAADTIQEYRVDRIAVFPSGEGRLITELFYSLRTGSDPWPGDGGTTGTDGWITGKCSRFDLISTETEHQLIRKRLCS